MPSLKNNKDQATKSLHKSQEWNKVLGKMIIRPNWEGYISFEEVVIEHLIMEEVVIDHLHDVDRIALCACSTIKMKRKNMESYRKIFIKIFK
jgi:hypothetical protein